MSGCLAALTRLCFGLPLWLLTASVPTASAQDYVNLVSFTNTWRYNQAGQDLGTNWVAPDYDDAADPWQSGPALLGVESTPLPGFYNLATFALHVIPTPLNLYSEGGTNGTNITFYFRSRFTCDITNLAGVEVWATNLVDDGCVIHLNGKRAADVRLPSTSQSYLTYANGFPSSEGQMDPVRLPASLLVPGTNTMAVEVHQSFLSSSDVAFAMRLVAIVSTSLVITSQPPSQVRLYAGADLSLAVAVAGQPADYRWQRNGVNIPGATGPTLLVSGVTATQSGDYRCIVTNVLNAVTSITSSVFVVPDIAGPRALEARVLETSSTNIVQLIFSETMLNSIASPNRNLSNYEIRVLGATNEFVPVTNVQVAGTSILLRVPADWLFGGNYYLVLNNLVDSRTNMIAPNTVVPIRWPKRFELLPSDAVWRFHAAADLNHHVYREEWTATNYVPGPSWGEGPGIFHDGNGSASECLAPLQTVLPFQSEPTLFRTSFQWPITNGPNARLTLVSAAADGLVLYLNGREVLRSNVDGGIDYYTRATPSTYRSCTTNTFDVSNLMPNTNWLVAAVLQTPLSTDIVFGLRASAVCYIPAPVPDNPAPVLVYLLPAAPGGARLSWSGYGYSLESTTNLSLGFESYPTGPWMPVAGVSIPYTNNLTGPERFFRLAR